MFKNFLKERSPERSYSRATVVDGKLILSLPTAITPIVWQMDFSNVKASALEINADDKDKHFILQLKTPKGENMDIARFLSHEDALNVLMSVSNALENRQEMVKSTKNKKENTGHKSNRLRTVFICFAILFLLFFSWIYLTPTPVGYPSASDTSSPFEKQNDAVGVPLSADDFLRGR